MGQLVERTVDHNLETQDREVAKRWYPDTDEVFSVRRFRPKPLTPVYNQVGILTGGEQIPENNPRLEWGLGPSRGRQGPRTAGAHLRNQVW